MPDPLDGTYCMVNTPHINTPYIKDLDAWRRTCMKAYENLSTNTAVTMNQVDIVLMQGAREAAALDTSTPNGLDQYEKLIDRVAQAADIDRYDTDAILVWCAEQAATLIEYPR